jgi:hypothetical protein
MRDYDFIFEKVEGSYGADAAPTAGTDALRVFDWEPTPMIYDDLVRNTETGLIGARAKAKARGRQGHNYKMELCGSGAALTPTPWGAVALRGCLFDAPSVGATEVTYGLSSSGDGASTTFYGQKDILRHRAQGVRGTATFNFMAGQLPYIAFQKLGLLNQLPDQAAVPVPVLTAYPDPVEVNTANTTFSLDGYAALLRSLEIELGNKTEYRDLVGQRAIIFGKAEDGDRRAVRGQLVIEVPDPNTKNYLTSVATRAALAMSLVHGTVAGNIVDVSTTRLFLDEPQWSQEQNRIMGSFGFTLVPSAAGNELTLKTR